MNQHKRRHQWQTNEVDVWCRRCGAEKRKSATPKKGERYEYRRKDGPWLHFDCPPCLEGE